MNGLASKFTIVGASIVGFGVIWAGVNYTMPDEELASGVFSSTAYAAEKAVIIPAPRINAKEPGKRAVAVFAGGCFWGVEGVFERTNGVISAVSGYHGGKKVNASYRKVSAGRTNHAEAVRLVYDPRKISYGKLMQIYFSVITDPTMLNRQGPDRGRHYRSALVPMNNAQAKAARSYIAQLSKGKYWRRPIVTRIESNKGFYRAEAYHQNYMRKNPSSGYIVHWDKPKVANFKRHFPKQYRAQPAN